MKTLGWTFVVGLVSLVSAAALAQGPLPTRFELRQLVLADGIEDAATDGRLTAEQVRVLHAEQNEIAAQEAEFRRDGTLTDREVEVLEYRLDLASRHIDRALRTPPQVAQGK